MDELQEQFNLITEDKEARYFYHITPIDGAKIMEEGLLVANPSWEQSFLEFNADELDNIELVLNENKKTKLRENNTIVIVKVNKEDEESFIRQLRDEEIHDIDFEGVGSPDYIVDPEFILGFIDLDTFELVVNEKILSL